MEQLHTFCRLYHKENNIPIYLYQDETLLCTFPEQTALTSPPEKYTRILFDSSDSVSCCSSDYGIYFGAVRHRGRENLLLILGPVSPIPYSAADLHKMYADYVVPSEQRDVFQWFLQTIPSVALIAFLDKLVFLNYCLNGEALEPDDILKHLGTERMTEQIIEKAYQKQETLTRNESYKIESIVMNLIRTGNLKGFEELQFSETNYHTGVLASNALRQIRNSVIVNVTLATRAAIEGGLDYDTAYELSDLYIQTAEQLDKPDDLYALMGRISYEFAQRVHDCQIPAASDDILQRAMHFVLQNVNSHITVSDVAEHVGFSRSYFSTYFKEQLGFSLSAFILRCKLEESRRLLQFTAKPLTEISNYLCFSSQSHYQTAFKKQYGVTPLQYRKNPSLPKKQGG